MKCNIRNYSKAPISNNMMKNNIRRIMANNQMTNECTDTILKLYDFMVERKHFGGCHAFSSVLYVALSELGLSPELCIGECKVKGTPAFDHSWITINGSIIDLAVYFPLSKEINSISGPVVMGLDAITSLAPRTQYGVDTGLPLSPDTTRVLNSGFVDYMDDFPMGEDGLWSVVMPILPSTHHVTVNDLRIRYKDVKRKFIK